MQVNASSLKDLYNGFNTSFNKGLKTAKINWQQVAIKVNSTGASENYSWLTDFPGLREWLGDRIVKDLSAGRYVVTNKTFEDTIAVSREKIEDDQYGTYGVIFEQMGNNVAQLPEKLVFSLLKKGETTRCYDDQFFFDTDHPGFDASGNVISVSNHLGGSGTPWYLLDCSQPVKPLVYQERRPFELMSRTDLRDDNVFFQNKYIYGTDGRANAGYGLWQLACVSKNVLNAANFQVARYTLTGQYNSAGDTLPIRATHLVVPPTLEDEARALVNATLVNGGETNILSGIVDLIVTPYI